MVFGVVCWQDALVSERDYLKQELGMFLEQIGSLEKENATLSREVEEKRETDEFKSLEEEFRKEHEVETTVSHEWTAFRVTCWVKNLVCVMFYRTSCRMRSPA